MATAKAGTAANRRIHLETERFIIRGMSVKDLDERWDAWGQDEEAMRLYNTAILGDAARDSFARTILAANGRNHFVPGVFEKITKQPIGFFTIKLDEAARIATFEYFIGDRAWWGKDAVLEARAALITHVFRDRGAQKVMGYPFSRNFSSIFNYLKQGWVQEGILRRQSLTPDRKERLDQHVFSLLAEEWDADRSERRREDD